MSHANAMNLGSKLPHDLGLGCPSQQRMHLSAHTRAGTWWRDWGQPSIAEKRY